MLALYKMVAAMCVCVAAISISEINMRKYIPITIRRPFWTFLKVIEDLKLVSTLSNDRVHIRTNLPPTRWRWSTDRVNELIYSRFDRLIDWDTVAKDEVERAARKAIGEK